METKWHSISLKKIFNILHSDKGGLSKEEAQRRLERYGKNKLPEVKTDSVLVIFLRQFQSPLIYVLLGAALIVVAIGEITDGIVISIVLILNAIIGAVQEGRAQNTLRVLRRFVETKAVVLRAGEELIVRDDEVVIGDIVLLQEGGKVPADARIISSNNLKIDESTLTGESSAIHKTDKQIRNPNLPVLEQKNMCFKGTNIVNGTGRAVVVRTGMDTYIGQVASKVQDIETEIPLKANIRNLSRLIIATTGVASLVLFILGLLAGNSPKDMFITVVSIAVSVIPEGLLIALTVVLATGVWRMGKKNALVKRLQAVEALGQARIIAVDKTGTLTKNEMMIEEVYVGGKIFSIEGVGYELNGNAKLQGEIVDRNAHPELLLAGKIASYCANSRVMYKEETKEWRTTGDPTEAAMFVLGEKLGFHKDDLERESPLISEIPFDFQLKYHATLHKEEGKTNFATIVGAPETILDISTKIWTSEGVRRIRKSDREEINSVFLNLSKKGYRILALSIKHLRKDTLEVGDVKTGIFVGFFAMRDSLRPEVKEAMQRAEEAGMKVVMITGDHKITAEAIAREAGIFKDGDNVLSGAEIDELSDNSLEDALTNTTVFARVTPEHKLRIINAYKARGEIIAMTGDGVNDAPSLVAADLGVSMGKIGTEVAKEASDIVLLDDNFGSIVTAIEEGRSIYKTIKKVVLYLTSTSVGEVLTITGSILLGLPLPLLPAQIIWLNFVTDGFLAMPLAMEPKESNLLKESFERPKKYLVDALMGKRMLVMAIPMMIGTLVLFQIFMDDNLAKAWTISLTLLAAFQWFNAWNCRSEDKSIFKMKILENKFLLGATSVAIIFQILAVYTPFLQKILRTVPLSFGEWLLILPIAFSVVIVEEIRKFFLRQERAKLATI